MGENNYIINRFFSRSLLNDIISNKRNDVFDICKTRYIGDKQIENNLSVIKWLYNYLEHQYRNEYFYKNTLINRLLLSRHSLRTATVISELPVNKSIADFIFINGEAVAYEIKTELDSLERIRSQISDYYKAFAYVNVVTYERNYERLKEILNETSVGIIILNEKNRLSVKRKPVKNTDFIDYSVIFKLLRKKEFENILINYFGQLPVTTQVRYYRECYEMFKGIGIESLSQLVNNELKKRNSDINPDYYHKYVPYELKFLVYCSKIKDTEYIKLNEFLSSEYGG